MDNEFVCEGAEMITKAKNIQDCIDAGITGGTLNTAKHAFQQKKPVLIGTPDGDVKEDVKKILAMMNEDKQEGLRE